MHSIFSQANDQTKPNPIFNGVLVVFFFGQIDVLLLLLQRMFIKIEIHWFCRWCDNDSDTVTGTVWVWWLFPAQKCNEYFNSYLEMNEESKHWTLDPYSISLEFLSTFQQNSSSQQIHTVCIITISIDIDKQKLSEVNKICEKSFSVQWNAPFTAKWDAFNFFSYREVNLKCIQKPQIHLFERDEEEK